MQGTGVSPLLIGIGEGLDDRGLEALLIVENVMGNAERCRHAARVMDILPGATRALAMNGFAVVVKLEGHAHHFVTLAGKQARHDR
jgi:hypothetical protein